MQNFRDGLVEQEHFGFVVIKKGDNFIKLGDSKGYPIYLRSCAKPLQASLLVDAGLDEEYNLTSEEIALCCASHAGEKCHTRVAKNLIKKFKIKESMIKCGYHKSLAKSVKTNKKSVLFNNCVGKHILMLGLCKHYGFDLESYCEKSHPLQQMIIKKLGELCDCEDLSHITKDGCGVPILGLPLENMITGFLNVFCNLKYSKIQRAFLENPYIIGGEDRTDTFIIQNTSNLVAKVGAEGLCMVANVETNEAFIVDILDSDMPTRELVVSSLINKLGWGNIEKDTTIKTLHGEVVGEKVVNLDF